VIEIHSSLSPRTCRACGCWELQACEGGCAWLSADRCSACPDATLTLPIRPAHIQFVTLEPVSTLPDDNGENRLFRAVEFPALVLVCRFDSSGKEVGVRAFVGEHELLGSVPHIEAAQLLNERRIRA